MMPSVAVVGGGAAGFFAAITAAGHGARVTLYEKSAETLTKVRISGGGRCNVTHACFEPLQLAKRYPRGGKALISAFHRFQPQDTITWFESRGVALKVEADGRMFPTTDSSATIIACLQTAAKSAGVEVVTRCGVDRATKLASGDFQLELSNGETTTAERLILTTGGSRTAAMASLSAELGHGLVPPVPSLFTFRIETPWVHRLAGVSVPDGAVNAPSIRLKERGPLLFTHWGLSGPAILRLSAWGAREMSDCAYRFPIELNWWPDFNEEKFRDWTQRQRSITPGKTIANTPPTALPARLWEALVSEAEIATDTRWAILRRDEADALGRLVVRTQLEVTGKSLNKEEFVTCGGVPLREVDFRTMESRICPGLYFAGEVLDIDGVTGGFNFQTAWTTGWIAGNALIHSR